MKQYLYLKINKDHSLMVHMAKEVIQVRLSIFNFIYSNLKKSTNQKFNLCYKRKEKNWLRILKLSLEHKDLNSIKIWFISEININSYS